jgi:hypothetical protein
LQHRGLRERGGRDGAANMLLRGAYCRFGALNRSIARNALRDPKVRIDKASVDASLKQRL